jgi:hypothetical protein
MKFPSIKSNIKMFTAFFAFAVFAIVTFSTVATFGQKTDGNPSADIDQCENGALGNGPVPNPPQPCNWVNGSLNRNNSQWKEGQSVPYRIKFSGLDANTPYTVTLGYDTTEGGVHTLDYLTTIDRSNVADPCISVGCDGTFNSFPIPLDPRVQAGPDGGIGTGGDDIDPGPDGTTGTGDDDTVSTGFFRIYGGATFPANAASAYSYNGDFTGNSQAFITLTFNSGPTPDEVVLGWSGHISSRFNWGFNNAAILLSGSSYHMRTAGGTAGSGNQDRSMKVDAVVFPGRITIRKQVNYFIGSSPFTTSPRPFDFSSTNFAAAFSLTDNRPGNLPDPLDPATYTDTIVIDYETFGQTITVTEDSLTGTNWSLSSMACTINGGGNNVVGTAVPGTLASRTVTIVLREANFASCVFVNQQITPSAAPASVAGRVATESGRGISGAVITMFNTATGESHTQRTNAFGYYRFNDMAVADFYVMTVSHKRYLFLEASRSFTLQEDMFDMDFTASEDF